MFESGKIVIPEFQREFVWSNNQVRNLAYSWKAWEVAEARQYVAQG
jgi:uncharacterized protein with ParB-like and HNH nuclease domain